MNDLVNDMNSKIQAAVQRGGDQVVFIDYDAYVDLLGGLYCLPGVDEDKGNGASRNVLFFYQMKTKDTLFMPTNDDPYHDELKRRENPTVAAQDTIDGEMGSWIQQTLQQNPNAQLNDDIANSDLDSAVASEVHSLQKAKKRGPSPKPVKARDARHLEDREDSNHYLWPQPARQLVKRWIVNGTSSTLSSTTSGSSNYVTGASAPYPTRPSVATGARSWSLAVETSGAHSPIARSSGTHLSIMHSVVAYSSGYGYYPTGSGSPTGTASNSTYQNDTSQIHPVENAAIFDFFVPDSVGRVFHPQQGGT